MILRSLKMKDAPLMLEWMHDSSVVEKMSRNFGAMTLSDCEGFIGKNELQVSDLGSEEGAAELRKRESLHLAIADEADEYQGTVSLKDIDRDSSAAEFAITIRRSAMGKGISAEAMREIIRLGHEEAGLKHVYWYVNKDNERAVRFYDKNGYRRCTVDELLGLGIKLEEELKTGPAYLWYVDAWED